MLACLSNSHYQYVAIFGIAIILLISVTKSDLWSVVPITHAQVSKDKVFVMYATSLIKTFEDTLGPSFQKKTGYAYDGEPRGSVQITNMIIDGLRKPDLFVSAGTVPIQRLMNITPAFADWLVKFGSAEMVIAYSPSSRFFSDLEKARIGDISWYEVLSQNGLKFGRTDPELDPKGYYMIITAELANLYYNDSEIKQKILGDDKNAKQIFPEEILKTILEQGQLDAVAAYKHEAVARGLPYITLPPQINLANPTFIDFYKKAVIFFGKRPNRKRGTNLFFIYYTPYSRKSGWSSFLCEFYTFNSR